ncbi:Hypothetical predicted protein [Octopus vulgaris]|uniref:Uncharacterized protein n=1 Tax=Octopus vulgaris TaxID=6645 RepID=A0AA36EWM1_OCTVU|nr:Hypothetical predicted protein [Octopus vulgaris]
MDNNDKDIMGDLKQFKAFNNPSFHCSYVYFLFVPMVVGRSHIGEDRIYQTQNGLQGRQLVLVPLENEKTNVKSSQIIFVREVKEINAEDNHLTVKYR